MITERHMLTIVTNRPLPLSQAFVTLMGWHALGPQESDYAHLDMAGCGALCSGV